MNTTTASEALRETAKKLLGSLPADSRLTVDAFQYVRTQPADRSTLADQLDRVLTDPDELDLYLGELQELLGDRAEFGVAWSEERRDQVLKSGLAALNDNELCYLALNPQQLLDLELGIEEAFSEHWSAVVGRVMDEYDRQEGRESKRARQIVADALRAAGLGQYVVDDPGSLADAVTDAAKAPAIGRLAGALAKGFRWLSEFPDAEVAMAGAFGESGRGEEAAKEIAFRDWFTERELNELLPWAGPVLLVRQDARDRMTGTARYVASVEVLASEKAALHGKLHVVLKGDREEKAEVRLTDEFPEGIVQGTTLPDDWGRVSVALFLEGDHGV